MAATTTVRISEHSRRALKDIAEQEHAPLQSVLERAIENYRRNRFLDAVNATYGTLRSDAQAWSVENEERDEWAITDCDGNDRE